MRLNNLLHLLSFNRWFTVGTVPEEVMEKLTEDILFQIFLKLPIKSLLACKCVCRTWCTSIRHRDFVDMHLIQSTQERYITDLIVHCHRYKYYGSDSDDLILLDEYDLAGTREKARTATTKIGHDLDSVIPPFIADFLYRTLNIIGSCNGLLCMEGYQLDTGRKRQYIFNPITRDHVLLPPITSPSKRFRGFGFDAWTGQYKVVLICNYRMEMEICTVESSGNPSPSWRRIENSPLPELRHYGVFADGALHWASDSPLRSIISLDMREDKFRVMPWPDFIKNPGRGSKILHEWRGHLSFFDYSRLDSILIWVSKDCKGKLHWSEELRIQLSIPSHVKNSHFIPLGIKKNGEILLCYDGQELASYDINNRRFRFLEVSKSSFRCELYWMKQVTLVSLNSHQTKAQKKKKRR